jgi:hypothetical protein
MRRAAALLSLGAVLLGAGAVVGSSAAFTATSSSGASTFATSSDWVAPAVTVMSPSEGMTTTATPTFYGTAGTAGGDSSTVTVSIYSGSAASGAPVQTKTASRVSGYWYVTATTLPPGTYTLKVTQDDNADNTGTATRTFTVPGVEPVAISAVNGGSSSQAGRLNSGDKITFTFSDPIAPTSVLSTFSGSSAPVVVRFLDEYDDHSDDSFTVLDRYRRDNVKLDAGSWSGVDGGVFTGRTYVTDTVDFTATMTRSSDGKSFVITLGTPDDDDRLVGTAQSAANMKWKPRSGPTDLAGNPIVDLSPVQETDNDRDF